MSANALAENLLEARSSPRAPGAVIPLPQSDVPPTPESRPRLVVVQVKKKEPSRANDRGEILRVLERAAGDPQFVAELTYGGSKALGPYALTPTAQAALVSGDVRWIETCAGKLDERLRTWLDRRLQQEIW